MASRILDGEPGLELDGSRCHFPGEASCRAESATAIVRSLYYVITVELLPAELPGMKRTLGRGKKKKEKLPLEQIPLNNSLIWSPTVPHFASK